MGAGKKMFRARLEFQDGAIVLLDVAADQSVVEAAMTADAPLRHDCASGSCGTCIGRLLTGDVERIESDSPIITPAERAAGIYPTCLTRLRSDAAFHFDYPLEPQPSPAARQTATVMEVTRLAESVVRLRIELADADVFRFQPGQYLRLRPPGLRAARAYSIASVPADLPVIELLIRLVPGGQVSGWLRDLAKPGDRVTVHGPLGGFALDDRATKHVFIAGGTGLAPMLSMIRQEALAIPRLLCFGCTRLDELFLLDELAVLAETLPALEVRVAAMESPAAGISQGTAVSVLKPEDLAPGTGFHLCGPPAMVNAARDFLAAHSVPATAIRAERFQPGA